MYWLFALIFLIPSILYLCIWVPYRRSKFKKIQTRCGLIKGNQYFVKLNNNKVISNLCFVEVSCSHSLKGYYRPFSYNKNVSLRFEKVVGDTYRDELIKLRDIQNITDMKTGESRKIEYWRIY